MWFIQIKHFGVTTQLNADLLDFIGSLSLNIVRKRGKDCKD